MIFLSQAQIDALLLEDIQGGDLTTRALNIGHQHGYIEFFLRQGGCISGISVACKILLMTRSATVHKRTRVSG